jgi:eukaryotic-like serine/threonine-protein kinase
MNHDRHMSEDMNHRRSLIHEVDRLSNRFEEAWRSGQRPFIDTYLREASEPARHELLFELLALEMALRLDEGEHPEPWEYQERFPDHAELVDAAFREAEQPPSPVGRFRVLRLHARGGMGEVSVAHDEELKRDVAFKEIRAEYAGDASARARFLQEAEITGSLEHPNIIPVYGLGQHDDGRPFYAMRLITGEESSLDEAVRRFHDDLSSNRDLTRWTHGLRKLLGNFLGVCNAVDYAHSRGIIHRDLKPRNIMIGRFGETLVIDWGFAKLMGQVDDPADGATERLRSSSGSTLEPTEAGATVGTPAYMSPEQAEGQTDRIGRATDIYGLGATLYCMLTGNAPSLKVPAEGDEFTALLTRVKARSFPKPRSVRPEVPRPLEAICLKAMALNPDERYASAKALAEDIECWLSDEPVSAFRERPDLRVARWARKHRAWVQVGAIALLLIAILTTVFAVLVVRERRGKDQALATERGLRLCSEGEVGPGVLWLAHALELTPTEDEARQRQLRTNLSAWLHQIHPTMGAFRVPGSHRVVAFTPDGGKALTLETDHFSGARLWNVRDGTWFGPLMKHELVEAAAFSPDGRTIVTAGFRTLQFWNAADGSPIRKPMPYDFVNLFRAVEFSADGRTICAWCHGDIAQFWNADGSSLGKPIKIEHDQGVSCMAFSADGRTVLTGGLDGTARLWNARDGSRVGNPMEHGASITTVAFNPENSLILTGGVDGMARQWMIKDSTSGVFGTARQWMTKDSAMKHNAPVTAAAYSPDGNWVVTGSADHTARLWFVYRQTPIGLPMLHDGPVERVALSAGGGAVLTAIEGREGRGPTVYLRETIARHAVGWGGHGSTAAVFSPSGQTFLIGSRDGTARLIQAEDEKMVGPLMKHGNSVTSVAFSPDGSTIVTGSDDQTARLWKAGSGTPIGQPIKHEHRVTAVAFSPDGRTVLTASGDGIRLWNVHERLPVGGAAHSSKGYNSSPFTIRVGSFVNGAAFSPDGQVIVTGSHDHAARLWKTSDGSRIGTPMWCGGPVTAVAFSPDGRLVLTGSDDRTAQLWNPSQSSRIGRPMKHDDTLSAVAFSRDGRMVLTGSRDHTARLWNAGDGSSIGPPIFHPFEVAAVATNPDGKTMLSGCPSSGTSVWTPPTAIEGEARRIALLAEALTGMELVQGDDSIRSLDLNAWRERRRHLGSPPTTP